MPNSKAITISGSSNAPTITSVQIKPSPAYDSNVLNCSGNYNDADFDKGNVTFSWYNGSNLYWQATQFNKMNNEIVNEPLTWYNKIGLVGYWKFSEGNGTVAYDISNNGVNINNGTFVNFDFNANSGWTVGKYGSGLKFDGSNDYVNVGNLGIGGVNTREFWFKPNNVAGSSNQYVMDFGGNKYWIQIYDVDSDGKLEIRAGAWSDFVDGNYEITDTTRWYHVAVTMDSGNTLTIYVNGNYDNSGSKTSGTLGTLIFGNYGGGGSYYFNRTID